MEEHSCTVSSGNCLKIYFLFSKPVDEDVEVSAMALLHLQHQEAENTSLCSVSVWEHRVMNFVLCLGSRFLFVAIFSAKANSK